MTTAAKLKVGELHAAYQVFDAVTHENAKAPAKSVYWIARNVKRLEPEYVPAESARIALIKEFGEEKNGQISVMPDKLSEFMAKWSEVTSVESDVTPFRIKISALEGVNMTPQQMLTLEKFVEE